MFKAENNHRVVIIRCKKIRRDVVNARFNEEYLSDLMTIVLFGESEAKLFFHDRLIWMIAGSFRLLTDRQLLCNTTL